jgi:hypothetical protein
MQIAEMKIITGVKVLSSAFHITHLCISLRWILTKQPHGVWGPLIFLKRQKIALRRPTLLVWIDLVSDELRKSVPPYINK